MAKGMEIFNLTTKVWKNCYSSDNSINLRLPCTLSPLESSVSGPEVDDEIKGTIEPSHYEPVESESSATDLSVMSVD